ncbi:MAG: myo-inosose-2 dehydratase [Bacteroidetes bacterium SB0662_bin_6]|nr:myo-inosose-2 dehydratase [Bacteroidetes bacterium SB0668_bin_1]MYE05457.1 myo-inosose-2 dehydratase [Bacteroidetes bacterium SB0662_bin_6]
MEIRFGVNPIAWSNDDLLWLGGETPLETCLTDTAELGFDGIELGNKFPRNATELRPILDQYGLALIGGWYSGNILQDDAESEIASLQDHLALLKALHCEVFIYAECSNTIHSDIDKGMQDKPVLNDETWPLFGQRLSEVADYIRKQGLRFAYHHHTGTVVETASELRRFFAETSNSVGIVLDTGHAYVGAIDPVEIVFAFPQRVAHVHYKDVRPAVLADIRAKNASFLTGVIEGMFTVPGDGVISFDPVTSALNEIGYRGWVVVEAEQDPGKADPRQYAEAGLAALRASVRAVSQ